MTHSVLLPCWPVLDCYSTIRSLNYLCWNDAYKPEAKAEGAQVLLQLVLASDTDDSHPSCPETTEDVAAFNKDLDTIATRLHQASDGLIRDTVWEVYTPGSCNMVRAALPGRQESLHTC